MIERRGSIFSERLKKDSFVKANTPNSIFGSVITRKPVEKGKVSLLSGSVVRKRIDVSLEDLDSFSSDLAVKKQALKMILEINLDNLKPEFVLTVGQEFQENHKSITEKCFSTINSPVIQDIRKQLSILLEYIEEAEHPSSQNAVLAKIGFLKEKAEKSFSDSLDKIKEISNDLSRYQSDLADYLAFCGTTKNLLNSLQSSMTPVIVMCEFFSGYQKDNFPKELFISRLTALLTTTNSINSNILQIELFKDSVISLKETISQSILTDIPMWLSNCLNQQQKQDIISKLKQTK
jgi:hypothetical protein